jgi:hypothetical protein
MTSQMKFFTPILFSNDFQLIKKLLANNNIYLNFVRSIWFWLIVKLHFWIELSSTLNQNLFPSIRQSIQFCSEVSQ